MRQLFFEEQNNAFWQKFEQDLQLLEQDKRLPPARTECFVQHYRTVCHHLAA